MGSMRVKEMADLAGTTTRTVRYYHRVGLLPVPPVVAGHRDYGIEHLARLLSVGLLSPASHWGRSPRYSPNDPISR